MIALLRDIESELKNAALGAGSLEEADRLQDELIRIQAQLTALGEGQTQPGLVPPTEADWEGDILMAPPPLPEDQPGDLNKSVEPRDPTRDREKEQLDKEVHRFMKLVREMEARRRALARAITTLNELRTQLRDARRSGQPTAELERKIAEAEGDIEKALWRLELSLDALKAHEEAISLSWRGIDGRARYQRRGKEEVTVGGKNYELHLMVAEKGMLSNEYRGWKDDGALRGPKEMREAYGKDSLPVVFVAAYPEEPDYMATIREYLATRREAPDHPTTSEQKFEDQFLAVWPTFVSSASTLRIHDGGAPSPDAPYDLLGGLLRKLKPSGADGQKTITMNMNFKKEDGDDLTTGRTSDTISSTLIITFGTSGQAMGTGGPSPTPDPETGSMNWFVYPGSSWYAPAGPQLLDKNEGLGLADKKAPARLAPSEQ